MSVSGVNGVNAFFDSLPRERIYTPVKTHISFPI